MNLFYQVALIRVRIPSLNKFLRHVGLQINPSLIFCIFSTGFAATYFWLKRTYAATIDSPVLRQQKATWFTGCCNACRFKVNTKASSLRRPRMTVNRKRLFVWMFKWLRPLLGGHLHDSRVQHDECMSTFIQIAAARWPGLAEADAAPSSAAVSHLV